MPASDASRRPGRPWRQRVRRLTAGILGAAVLTSGGIVAILASNPDATAGTPTAATAIDGAATSSTGFGSASGSLTGPTRTPSSSTGHHHATTGGS